MRGHKDFAMPPILSKDREKVAPSTFRGKRCVIGIAELLLFLVLAPRTFGGDVIIQYFESRYATITRRTPDVFMAGYRGLWIPPTNRAEGGQSALDDVSRLRRLAEACAHATQPYIDIELGDSVLMADWVYLCDFDHRMDDINVPIKDQGILKGPVRIGPDTWIATKVTILRNTTIGRGCVLGSHAVVKGDIPDYSIAVGAPAKVVKNRKLAWDTSAAERAKLAAALADIERKKASR
jgi:hypothetical protein